MAGSRVRFSAMQRVLVAVAVTMNPLVVMRSHAQHIAVATPDRAYETQRITLNVDDAPIITVLNAVAHQAGLIPGFNGAIIPSDRRITLRVRNVTVSEAFEQALRGTGLRANVLEKGDVAIVKDAKTKKAAGTIAGRVSDVKTKRPIQGALVTLDGVGNGKKTKEDGTFTFVDVEPGQHALSIRLLGYIKGAKTITVVDGQVASVDIALDHSVNALDQVVVTGTVVATELKAVPSAITVITAKQLEQRGITRIDQLFHGDVPGLFAQNQGSDDRRPGRVLMSSRGATTFDGGLNQAIKTYIDGVELADPSFLGTIDPRSIERIEILTGPQASTVYGSNAINGVMQIFTKRGTTSRPQLTLILGSGLIQNGFTPAVTSQHDYSGQISGVDGRVSYNGGGSWNHTGPWTPSITATTMGGFGGARFQYGPAAFDFSVRRNTGTNQSNAGQNQHLYGDAGSGKYRSVNVVYSPVATKSTTQTYGLTTTYAPVSWWSHTATLGSDHLVEDYRYLRAQRHDPADSLLNFSHDQQTRTALSYSTTLQSPVIARTRIVATAGVDGWQTFRTLFGGSATTLTGFLPSSPSFYEGRFPNHNRGAFFQGQIGIWESMFLTYGVRTEWNPNYGESANPNTIPRYGIAYTKELGPVMAKLRASYGRSTRPPTTNQRLRSTTPFDVNIFGPDAYYQLANSALLPEQQRGGEGGMELYFGNRASLIVTRFNQTVDDLILPTPVDSVASLTIDPYGFCPFIPSYCGKPIYLNELRNLNVGSIRNQGWELQATGNAGPFSVKGTYSFTKSRVIGVTQKYRQHLYWFTPGAVFWGVPEHTYALQLQYARQRTSVSLNLHGQGMLYLEGFNGRIGGTALFREVTGTRLSATNAPRMTLDTYVGTTPAYALGDLNVSHAVSAHIDGTLQIQNIANHYTSDSGYERAVIGRQTKFGVRVRY
jgi:outer membrane receptor protein involved in Fe transport